jgi:hypothetical protein
MNSLLIINYFVPIVKGKSCLLLYACASGEPDVMELFKEFIEVKCLIKKRPLLFDQMGPVIDLRDLTNNQARHCYQDRKEEVHL